MVRNIGKGGIPAIWRIGERAVPSGPHVAVVPGAQVPLLPLELPDQLLGMARERVAERQMVELLSAPADSFEMRPFSVKSAGQWSRALVVDAGLAAAWRKGLHAGSIALIPDYLMLPCAPDVWVVDVQDGQVMARLGPADGFSAEPDLARASFAQMSPPKAILRLGEADETLDTYLATLDVKIVNDPAALKSAGFNLMRWTEATGGIDLKDPPSAVYDRLRDRILRWRMPAVIGALALAVWMATTLLQTQNLNASTERAHALTRDLVRAHFVPAGPILDIRAQVTNAVANVGAGTEPDEEILPALTQLQIAAPILTAEVLQLQAASYRADTGLVAVVGADDFATMDQLMRDLRNAGFTVEELDSRAQQTGGVVARLRLELQS